MNIEADAAQATGELRLTEAAFDTLRANYLDQAVGAQDPQGALAAIAAARILDDVRAKVRAHLDTRAIELAARDEA
jgi:hypothetical protein